MQTVCLPELFEELALDGFKPLFQKWPVRSELMSNTGVTIAETDEGVTVEVPVPGAHKENIQITYEKGFLLVKAEEGAERAEEKSAVKYHLKASRRYTYHIPVPTRVDEQASPEASYTDGILRVTFAKSRSARPQKIAIK